MMLWNGAESENGRSFYVTPSAEDVMVIMRRSIERGVTWHFHELLGEVSKVFFDIDIAIPDALIHDKRVTAFCQEALSDNGESYASIYLGYF